LDETRGNAQKKIRKCIVGVDHRGGGKALKKNFGLTHRERPAYCPHTIVNPDQGIYSRSIAPVGLRTRGFKKPNTATKQNHSKEKYDLVSVDPRQEPVGGGTKNICPPRGNREVPTVELNQLQKGMTKGGEPACLQERKPKVEHKKKGGSRHEEKQPGNGGHLIRVVLFEQKGGVGEGGGRAAWPTEKMKKAT